MNITITHQLVLSNSAAHVVVEVGKISDLPLVVNKPPKDHTSLTDAAKNVFLRYIGAR